jgi:hypothetical protein
MARAYRAVRPLLLVDHSGFAASALATEAAFKQAVLRG